MTETAPKKQEWVEFPARLRSEEHEQLRREAFERRISMSELIRQALEAYLNTPR